MKILHTSDWHLGRTLCGRKRYEEFEAFLAWLSDTIRQHEIDALLVAGDVFDTGTPSNRAQELYYRFLCRTAASTCRHVVVVAGNHDSPSFLDAPRALLKALDVHVIGRASQNPGDEVLVLTDGSGAPALIVCAVPYLRDRDIRTAEAGESPEDKDRKLVEGIRRHYADVADRAGELRAGLGARVPVVATGHLFTSGGRTVDGDGVRELYVGSLARVTARVFPETLDYVALGHLHVPQRVDGSETVRYSGSPLPMGFGEAGRPKRVCLVEFSGAAVEVRPIEVPVFQALERVRGGWDAIAARLRALAAEGSRAWLEVVHDGEAVVGDLRERLEAAVSGTDMELLRVRSDRAVEGVPGGLYDGKTLDDLDPAEVFERCLEARDVPEDQRPELRRAHGEALASLYEDDARAE